MIKHFAVKILLQFFVTIFLTMNLASCLVAAAGAGAASGYYFDKHYKIVKKK